MKILITGGTYGLGKDINQTMLDSGYDTHLLGSIDSYVHHLPNIINDYDVFINNEYRDKVQSDLFEKVYNFWKYKPKTIVNILTSAIYFGGPNQEYIDNKQDLESKTISLRSADKKVRIVNIYPHTLETSKAVTNQKLKLKEVSNIIKFAIELPQDLELFSIGLSRTELEINKTVI